VQSTGGGGTDATLWWVYDGQQVVLELTSDAVVAERYLPGPAVDQVLAEEDALDAITSWLLADTRGTVRDVVEFSYNDVTQSGATYLFDHLEYGGYGQTIYESHPSENPGVCYNGQYWDSYSGSYCCEARWYNPSTGRYQSEDPTGFSAGDANLYGYVFNDPVNLVDPTGEMVGGAGRAPMLARYNAMLAAQNAAHPPKKPLPGQGGDWMSAYSNWFDGLLGSGWSNAAGGAIYTGLVGSGAVDNNTLAGASAGQCLAGTVAVAVPLGIAIFAGGEVLLGVGEFGGEVATLTWEQQEVIQAVRSATSLENQAEQWSVWAQLAENAGEYGNVPAYQEMAEYLMEQAEAEWEYAGSIMDFLDGGADFFAGGA
jgi:RHS repeat-associated protein